MVHSAQTCSSNARLFTIYYGEHDDTVHRHVLVMHAAFTIYFGKLDDTQCTDMVL